MNARLNVLLMSIGLALDALIMLAVIGSWHDLGRIGNGDQTIFVLGVVLGTASAATGYLGLLIQRH